MFLTSRQHVEGFKFNNEGVSSFTGRRNGVVVEISIEFMHLFSKIDSHHPFYPSGIKQLVFGCLVQLRTEDGREFKPCKLVKMKAKPNPQVINYSNITLIFIH